MKVKQRTVCQACRSRKIKCDGKTPSCTQCLARGFRCPGYQSEWTFVPQQRKKPSKQRVPSPITSHSDEPQSDSPSFLSPTETSGSSSSQKRQSPPFEVSPTPSSEGWELRSIPQSPSLPLLHVVTLVVRSYVPDPDVQLLFPALAVSQPRICGGWVECLPDLIYAVQDDIALSAAVKCLALAIMSGGPARKAPISAGLEAYGTALSCLGRGLRKADNRVPDDLVASVMCLLLAELILPTSLRSWVAHVAGFASLVQNSSPELFVSGSPHRLFVGARPALIILAFMSRKATFLNLEPWKTIPFSQLEPSPVQALLNKAVAIPALLEKIDSFQGRAEAEQWVMAKDCLEEFQELLVGVAAWEQTFHAKTPFPAFWMKRSGEDGELCIWFQGITTANALTHYWAVQIICRETISMLRSKYLGIAPGGPEEHGQELAEDSIALAIKICQSIEYLMQDDMKLFGPTSVMLPLKAAYDVFATGGIQTTEQLMWCQRIIAKILGKGFQFVTLFFDIFQIPQGRCLEIHNMLQ